MRVRKSDLAEYLERNVRHINKAYQGYLDALGLKRNYLTVFDVAKIDDIEPYLVAKLMHFSKDKVEIIRQNTTK